MDPIHRTPRASPLHRAARALLDLLFPKAPIEGYLETVSPARFADRAERSPETPEGISAIFSYKDRLVRDSVRALKYHGNKDAALLFARLLLDRILEDAADDALFEGGLPPLLVPIPLSRERLRERGYNQAGLICDALAALAEREAFEPCAPALRRIRHGESQTTTLSRAERAQNLKGAFAADEALVRSRSVIVVDDVTTTGATLREAKRALVRAGARRVRLWAIAH